MSYVKASEFINAIKEASTTATKNHWHKPYNCVRIVSDTSNSLLVEGFNAGTRTHTTSKVETQGLFCLDASLLSQESCSAICSLDVDSNELIHLVPCSYGLIVITPKGDRLKVESIKGRFPSYF